eukprot:COSAG05_NODE_6522_length_943_cov_1.831754_1_plen_82_part_00
MPGVRRSARNRGDTGGAREEEEEVPPDRESPAPEPEGSESSFATGADEEGSLLDRLLARVAAGEEVSATVDSVQPSLHAQL